MSESRWKETTTLKNVVKRGDIYYLRAVVNGRRISQSLQTRNKEEATIRARRLLAAARRDKWDVVDNMKSRVVRRYATIGELIAAYRVGAKKKEMRDGSPRPSTVRANVNQLSNILRKATDVDNIESLCSDVLTRDLLDEYVDRTLANYTERGEIILDRGRQTTFSSIRQAKSVVTRWALEEYKSNGLNLPDVSGFLNYTPVRLPDRSYQMPAIELVELTERRAAGLAEKNKDLYAAYLLARDLGMRASEAAAAKWSWIEQHDNGRYMVIKKRPDFVMKSRAHLIRIADKTWNSLRTLRFPTDEFILPGGSPTSRNNLYMRELTRWMRNIGWDGDKFPKGGHELRKLAGARWYTHHGLEVAAEWLGDNPYTVFKYYANLDPRKHPEPVLNILSDAEIV